MFVDQPQFEHRSLEAIAADLMVDAVCFTQQLADLAAFIGREVAPDARAKVGGFAHVEHLASASAEQIDAGGARKSLGELELLGLGVSSHLRQGEEVVEPGDPDGTRPLEQKVEEFAGSEGVVEGSVTRPMGETEAIGQGAEAIVRYPRHAGGGGLRPVCRPSGG